VADGDPVTTRLERSVEAQLREARERGEFDNLPGYGKPLPDVDGDHDEMWWIRQWLRRENLGFTPPALAIRKSVEDMLAGLDKLLTERAVRGVVEELNNQIRELNRTPQFDGPPTSLSPLDVDEVVARWQTVRPVVPVAPEPEPAPAPAPPHRGWWARLSARRAAGR
jgi:hypothetical protein